MNKHECWCVEFQKSDGQGGYVGCRWEYFPSEAAADNFFKMWSKPKPGSPKVRKFKMVEEI